MWIKSVTGLVGFQACTPILLALLSPAVVAQSAADIERMNAECESAREQALAPVREQKTRSCIEQKIRSPGHCERYYTTYGNTTITGNRRTDGLFYDLPECQAYLDARETRQASHSRNPK